MYESHGSTLLSGRSPAVGWVVETKAVMHGLSGTKPTSSKHISKRCFPTPTDCPVNLSFVVNSMWPTAHEACECRIIIKCHKFMAPVSLTWRNTRCGSLILGSSMLDSLCAWQLAETINDYSNFIDISFIQDNLNRGLNGSYYLIAGDTLHLGYQTTANYGRTTSLIMT